MEQVQKDQFFWKIVAFTITFLVLSLNYAFMRGLEWNGSLALHSSMEIIATLLALFISLLALVNYYSRRNETILFISTGFIGTAILDGYHSIYAYNDLSSAIPTDDAVHFSWTWLASRCFLSFYLILSFLVWKRKNNSSMVKPFKEKTAFGVAIMFTFLTFIIFKFSPAIPQHFIELTFPHPTEFIPAIFFACALIGYLYKGYWKHNSFDCFIVISIIINLVSQTVYMPNSSSLFDLEDNIGHILKF
ncbi:MAG: MASE3 domain-containing protein [Emcibacteraceae bacterium]|nr:MASE3 domain-containing protein [Emcibacteraceae bacterium]